MPGQRDGARGTEGDPRLLPRSRAFLLSAGEMENKSQGKVERKDERYEQNHSTVAAPEYRHHGAH